MDRLVECVPNFSEGRDHVVIEKITAAIEAISGVRLLDVDPGADTNRTVVTILGEPDAIVEAAFEGIRRASELIDMRRHQGAHPRHGATDVCPFVPVAGVTMEDCVELARRLGRRVGDELDIPVYLYEEAATRPERKSLADVRAGEYEALEEKLGTEEWKPDFGPNEFRPKVGVVTIGAREFLIAYNVNLNTRNHKKANAVAFDVRSKGRMKKDEFGEVVKDQNGEPIRVPGALEAVRGIGWYLDEYQLAQISMNLTNYKVTPVHVALEETREAAKERGMIVTGSELVGLVPRQAMLDAGTYYLEQQKTSPGQPEEEVVRIAVQSMGLEELKSFEPADKIIEYRAGLSLAGPLMKMTGREFLNELSTDSPAPGGGSVAALAGSLAASLAAMVANLTTRNKRYKEVRQEMCDLAVRGQEVKDRLCLLVDEDTHAFNRLLDAFRMPKGTEEEEKERAAAIAEATKGAAEVPFTVMERSLEAIGLAKTVAEKGLDASSSDAGVAALMGQAAVKGAHLNVLTNLKDIEDREFAKELAGKARDVADRADREASEVLEIVHGNVAGE